MRLLCALALALALTQGAAAQTAEAIRLDAGHRETGLGDCDKADTYYADTWYAFASVPTGAGGAGAGVEYTCYRYDRYDGYKGGGTFWRAWAGVGSFGAGAGWYDYDLPPQAHCETLLVTPVSGPHDLGCALGKPPRMPYFPERDELLP